MLLVWVFALGTGIANACSLKSRVAAADHIGGSMDAREAQKHVFAQAHEHPAHSDSTPVNCVKSCEDEKAFSVYLKVAPDLSAPCLLSRVLLSGMLESLSLQGGKIVRTDETGRWQAPPIPVTLLRLTL